ncbi:hypothetical protein HQ403_02005 [Candidatus Kaiserbacteria bacterium]|nr:hypothetical protein [Candidatus Kaiserbacteria bacterium]
MIPGGVLFLTWVLTISTLVVSTMLSSVPTVSLTGLGYEAGTTTVLVLFFVLLLISSIILQKKGRLLILYMLIVTSSFIVFLFELINILGGGSLLSETETLIGNSFNLAIFAGFVVVLTLTIVTNPLFGKILRLFSSAVLALALIILALLSFKLTWVTVAVFSFIALFSHKFIVLSSTKTSVIGSLSKTATLVLVIAVFFISFGGTVTNITSKVFNISPVTDIRPTWVQTYTILSNTSIKDTKSSLFGSGPNTFSYQWDRYKPISSNSSPFWRVTPEMGWGFLPTLVVTTGLLGIFVLATFIYVLFSNGLRTLFVQMRNNEDSYFLASAILCSLYGWLWALLYPINVVILMLIAVTNGGLLALLIQRNKIPTFPLGRIFEFRRLFMMFVVVSVLCGVWGLYKVANRFVSIVYYEKTLVSANQAGGVSNAEKYALKALEYSNQASFYRTLSEIQQEQMRVLLSQRGELSSKELQKNFEELELKSRENARRATQLDKENYLNWVVFGNHYFNLVYFSIPEAHTEGDLNYEIAAKLNPNNPVIPFLRARLALSGKDIPKAVSFLERAVLLKPDYVEARTLLSQLRT